jgi:ubiquitin-protein ligase
MYAPDEWLVVRLTAELEQLEQIRCAAIDFKRPSTMPFDHLYLTYHIRSVAALDAQEQPVYRDRHDLVLDVPPDYPEMPPVARMATGCPPPFHPNFWNHGANYGLVCIHGGGTAAADPGETLALLVLRIGRMLQYEPVVTQAHQGPNDAAAHWYNENCNRADLFPTDRQVLPLLRGSALITSVEDESFTIY